MLKIGISGASGRMGKELITVISDSKDIQLTCALIEKDSSLLNTSVGEHFGISKQNIKFSDELNDNIQVLIDFSLPQALEHNLNFCLANKIPLVIGTTGFDEQQLSKIKLAGQQIPILQAANMSVGVNLCLKLVDIATRMLGEDYDIEILDIHHRFKLDSPSGTAIALGQAAANARGENLAQVAVYERQSKRQARDRKQIGIVSMRMGDYVGEHRVIFSTIGETIEIVHKASSRATFANGALRAAKWLVKQKAGFYTMSDVLGI